jgi:penicillin-binding protein A
MNRPIRRVAVAVAVLMLALLLNLNYVQVWKADSYRNNPNNNRVLLNEYANPRGQIIVGGAPIAESKATNDELKYLRVYPQGPEYAPVTGYYSQVYGKDGIEDAEDGVLSGDDERLFTSRLADILTGRAAKGGSVALTLNAAAQTAAYTGLGNRKGAVVAIDPSTGAILALATSPSYDPSTLSSHNTTAVAAAYRNLNDNPAQPMDNRALNESYPPGSIFKVVVAAAALKNGSTPSSVIPAPTIYKLPGTASATMQNFDGESCGNGKTTTLIAALTISCNTAFGGLGVSLGTQAVKDEAALFGIDDQTRDIPLTVARSTTGPIIDDAALAQSSIGQRDVQVTPMEGAMMAAAVANNGSLMKPYLVAQEIAPDLSVLTSTKPSQMSEVLNPTLDQQLQAMMINVVAKGTGTKAQIAGEQVGGKTGTADNSDSTGKALAPHAWFIGFALDADHPIAIAVFLQNAGVTGSESAGGEAAAPLAKNVMQAYLADMKGH